MNASTQPSEGAGGSRSRAAGELTLGLMSGEKQWVYADLLLLFCGSGGAAIRLAREGSLTADQFLSNVPSPTVGASLLAMAAYRPTKSITGERTPRSGRPVGRLAFAFALAFDLLAPSRGRVEVLRSGQPGMDAGLAAAGHGWPMAAGPRSRTGARVCRALARHRTSGARALGYLGLFQVTRRKGGTLSGRYRRNGYVHQQKIRRPTHSLRGQSRSHRVRE